MAFFRAGTSHGKYHYRLPISWMNDYQFYQNHIKQHFALQNRPITGRNPKKHCRC
jgi:hypothetical protein